ncbi:hypothetical protein M5D96_012615 [Drosophila gunungcola]|uniref:Uncharacterized protein n=1 Tax=Drosophila gunungcola TaxID=103775 RepID=A0A9Q0BJ99_9MUSC|nr:hypothetical protein M5D96_012615 [Drosophila gunungcola]
MPIQSARALPGLAYFTYPSIECVIQLANAKLTANDEPKLNSMPPPCSRPSWFSFGN